MGTGRRCKKWGEDKQTLLPIATAVALGIYGAVVLIKILQLLESGGV